MSVTIIQKNSLEDQKESFAIDILTGLSSREKYISSKYFYDDEGSQIFSKIMTCQDYYPTRTEESILRNHGSDLISKLPDSGVNLIELGAGDGKKTRILLDKALKLGKDVTYIPIDISEYAVNDLVAKLKQERPDLKVHGLVGEYGPCLKWINKNYENKINAVLFLGSTVGNFSLSEGIVFFKNLWRSLNNKDLCFIGFDLKKDIDVLLYAYNDRDGLTREFNLNVLNRINRELGGEFKVKNFQHYGTYNAYRGSMESYLVSLVEQEVYIKELEKVFQFKAFESIHMEYSYKYLPRDITYIASETGYKVMENYSDERNYYVNSLWSVEKKVSK